MKEYVNTGKIAATFGIKGELVFVHALGKKVTLKNIETLFIEEVKGNYIPYFVESSKAKTTTEIYVKLEGVTTKEAAHRFIKKQVWLQEEDFRKLVSKSSPVALLGFELFDANESLGLVEEIIEQPHQVLLRITYKSKEALIPLHENTLQHIDHKKKQVHVILPDGLLEIYS